MSLAAYDVFEHLRKSLLWKVDDLIVPLTAHFDASGTEPQHLVWAIGGWIAETDQWIHVNREWARMLKETRFRPDVKERIFHAADLESLAGIYSDWTQDEKREFQDRAYQIIQDYQLFPIASAVIKADFEALKIRLVNLKERHGSNYFVHTFHAVMTNVRHWLDAQRYEASVHYVFEAGDVGEPAIQEILRRIFNDPDERKLFRMSGWTFTGKECLPLQTADIWAYESYKQMMNRIVTGPMREVRYPYRRLYRDRFRTYQTYWDRENLAELVEKYREIEEQQEKVKRGGTR